jgi:SAM-dependent methyltransferase
MTTIARRILNEQLDRLAPHMVGEALDIGGERVQVMQSFQRPDIRWKYLNIDERHSPDYVGSADHIPVDDEVFDTVLLLETLEHVADPDSVLNEAFRVLKTGGRLFLSVPFMYRHHPNPTDYIRWTHEKLFVELEEKRRLYIEVFLPRGGWLSVMLNDLSIGLSMFVPGTFLGSSLVAGMGRLLSFLITRSYPLWIKLDRRLCDAETMKSSFHRFTLGDLIVVKKTSKDESIPARKCPDVLRKPLYDIERPV